MHIATLFDRSFLVECLALCQRATAVRQPLYLCTLSAFLLIVSSCHSCSSIAETNANHSIGGWGGLSLIICRPLKKMEKNHHPLTYSLSLFSLPNKNVDVKLSMFVLIKNFSSNEHCNAQPTKGPSGFGLCGPRAP
jgi:hypothetical protein